MKQNLLIAGGILVATITGCSYFKSTEDAPTAKNPSPQPSAEVTTPASPASPELTNPTATPPSSSTTPVSPTPTTSITPLPYSSTTPTLPELTTPITPLPYSSTTPTLPELTTPTTKTPSGSTTPRTKTRSGSKTPASTATSNLTSTEQTQPKPSDFSQFRLRLLEAVNRRDPKFIRSIVTAKTEGTKGGKFSPDSYNIGDRSSKFWAQMDKALTPGCAIDSQAQVADKEPGSDVWVCPDFSQMKQSSSADTPSSDYRAVVGKNINVRAKPSADSKVVGVASDEIVAFDNDAFKKLSAKQQKAFAQSAFDGWTPVKLGNGKRGWVQNRYVYDGQKDYRVSFVRSRGQWRLRYFLPGNGNQ